MKYETVIGLEVHVELATESKIFCSCSAHSFGADPNSHVCPACCGMPGMLPVVNRRVVDFGMKAGLMLNCDINRVTTFDKKSYYYPDLPGAYQTTQWFAPVAVNGRVDIETSEGKKSVRIKQIHMEEDAGKLVHDISEGTTHVDFNRTSVPLIEIVSQPDLSSAEEVEAYLIRLRTLLRYAKVAECEMAHGTMRCDVNLSVRPAGSDVLGVRTEMKNMNSIEAIKRAIAYETERHIDAIENGTEVLVQETRRWDDAKGKSYAMRSKETAGDYRYFPDPNVMPVVIDDEWFNTIQASVPEFPEVKREKYIALGLTEYDAERISESIMLCECFEEASEACGNPKEVVNWITSDVMRILNAKQMTYEMLNLDNKAFGKLIALTVDGKISRANSKKILSAMFDDRSIEPEAYAEANDMLIGEQNDDMILEIVKKVVESDPKSVNDFKGGKEKALMALFGKCMKELKGNCDPQQLKVILLECVNNA